ncbi:heparinase II/III domain-containing protein [Paenibacillus sp. MAH-36]|uniref:Heparinase II/III family protein n=1 Tax=Paenibacillus violae TaxID=3077234 RepID=A0ABU3RD15_9BACL|nr:heparinase II/III family protein [Paenibacillus sp. PFR10]MDU0202185.1 heparinase II/III family protein [Paenibacillus sp. PFR10]
MNSRTFLQALLAHETEHKQLFHEAHRLSNIQSKDNTVFQTLYNEILSNADGYLNKPIEALTFTLFNLFRTQGTRAEFELAYFDRRRRLAALVIAALRDESNTYISALEDTIWAMCDEFTWCLPAHLNIHDAALEGEEDKHIDLFAAETAHALSETCHLLGDRLGCQVVNRVRQEVLRRVITPYMSVKRAFWWETCDINWAAVCAGSVGMAAIYLLKDSKALLPILTRVIDAMDCFLVGFTDEGACLEGLVYWNYGFGYYMYFSELLKQRTGGKLDLLQSSEKVHRIALFPQRCFLHGNQVANFSDCSRVGGVQPGIFSRLSEQFADIRIASLDYLAQSIDNCGRLAVALRNVAWLNEPLLRERIGLQQGTDFLPEAQWLIARHQAGDQEVSFAAKGGHNDEPHNHNDIGNFIWLVNGVRWIDDLGAGLYTRAYFGTERYSILCNSSLGHNVPIVNGQSQREGRAYAGQVLEISSTETEDRYKLNIAKAYEVPGLQRLEREFVLDKQKGKLTLTDTFAFVAPGAAVTERFITLIKPELVCDGEIRLEAAGKSQLLRYEASKLMASITTERHLDHGGYAENVFLIDLTAFEVGEGTSFTVTLEEGG